MLKKLGFRTTQANEQFTKQAKLSLKIRKIIKGRRVKTPEQDMAVTQAFGRKKLTPSELAKAEQNMYGYNAAKELSKNKGRVNNAVRYNIEQGIAIKALHNV